MLSRRLSPLLHRIVDTPLPGILIGLGACAVLLVAARPAEPAQTLPDEDFEQLYFDEGESRYAKDHTLIHDGDLFHLFYVSGDAGGGWSVPGSEIAFGHATSSDLRHWTQHDDVMPIDPAHDWKARNIWAPHVIPTTLLIGGGSWNYVMAYTGVDSSYNQEIGIAVSNDLFAWTDLSVAQGAYHPDTTWAMWDAEGSWSVSRDPFLLERNGELALLTTTFTRDGYQGQPVRGAIGLATTQHGLLWIDGGAPLVVNDHYSLMSSSHLVANPANADWHLFYTRQVDPGGIHFLTSSEPLAGWDIASDLILDAASIASEITEVEGVHLLSHVVDFPNQAGLAMRGVRFDSLTWPAGVPTPVPDSRFADTWTLVEGDLGAQPTYGDRPGFRSGQPSNIHGRFWINTAEDYAGPLGGACDTCLADETQIGRLRSIAFPLEHNLVNLRVGGSDLPECYVALVDSTTGDVLVASSGPGSDLLTQLQWDVSAWLMQSVYFEIVDLATDGHISVDAIEGGYPLAIGDAGGSAPRSRFDLRVSPNPAGRRTSIAFEFERAVTLPVLVRIYGADGRLVRSLAGGIGHGSRHQVEWDGRTTGGAAAPAGIYFVQVTAGDARATGRLTLLH